MPTHRAWRKAVADLKEVIGPVTSQQRKLAKIAGIRLPKDLPKLVAAARLKAALAPELCFAPISPSTDAKLEMLASLNAKRARFSRVQADQYEADGWIEFHLLKRRLQALERLRLEAGDIVEILNSGEGSVSEVVSIASDGRIHFKGGHGAVAWPDMVKMRCRNGSRTANAQKLREAAANQALKQSDSNQWSAAKQAELDEFRSDDSFTYEDIEQLQAIIDSAKDEKPIQNFLEKHPEMLTALLGGTHARFCIPRPRLAGTRVPDFFLSDVDSLGIQWLLVELETPISSVTLRKDNVLDKYARKGVSQVEEWREWVQDNLSLARRSRREGGLGFFDIRPRSEGVVFVGRRSRLLENASTVRNIVYEDKNIHVHTYDWLIERLKGVLSFSGPSGANPYLLHHARNAQEAQTVLD